MNLLHKPPVILMSSATSSIGWHCFVAVSSCQGRGAKRSPTNRIERLLLACRDALQHLPCKIAVKALEKFAAAEATYYLLGSYEEGTKNYNISLGHYYSINLRLRPFDLQSGILASYSEHTRNLLGPNHPTKALYLISGTFLRSRDFPAMMKGCEEL